MSNAKEIFDTIISFKQDDPSGESSQDRLVKYCNQILGSIEHYHVDFKEKSDRRDSNLSDDDKKNLAKAISGFANSGGGVLIWGIEDEKIAQKSINDIEKFVGELLKLSSQVTDPGVKGIDGDWIPSESANEGFALIYIPESELPPHRVLLKYKDIKDHYYFRSGSSFRIASHTQLEDMFGRRPKPVLSLGREFKIVSKVYLTYLLGIKNEGRGIAKYPLLSIKLNKPYSIDYYGIDNQHNYGLIRQVKPYYSDENIFSSSDIVIYPGIPHDVAHVSVTINIDDQERVIEDLFINFKIAAEGINPVEGKVEIKGSDIFKEAKELAKT